MEIMNCDEVVRKWKLWCGETRWSISLQHFGDLGGKIRWYDGYPQSKSAIRLTFTLIAPDGAEFHGSRLRDIRRAIDYIKYKNIYK